MKTQSRVMILAVGAIGVALAAGAYAAEPASTTARAASVAPAAASAPVATHATAAASAPAGTHAPSAAPKAPAAATASAAPAIAASVVEAPAPPAAVVAPTLPQAATAAPVAPAPSMAEPDVSKLGVRPEKPLTLAPARESSDIGTKLAVMVVIAGVAFAFWQKRKSGGKIRGKSQTHTLNVTARARVGLRAEIVIVEVDGQTLLLGVTPQTIQTLSTLSDAGDPLEARELEDVEDHAPAHRDVRSPKRGAARLAEDDSDPAFGSRLTALVHAMGREDRATMGSANEIPRGELASTRASRTAPRRRHDEAQVLGLKRRPGNP